MCRGLGSVERTIDQLVESCLRHRRSRRSIKITVADVTFGHYRLTWGQDQPSNAQRKAATRALHSYARKNDNCVMTGGVGREPLVMLARKRGWQTNTA